MSRTPFHVGQFLYYTYFNSKPFAIIIGIKNEFNAAVLEELNSGKQYMISFESLVSMYVTEEERDKFIGDDRWRIN